MTIYIDVSPDKGLGVFAGKEFQAGEIIEKCPVIVLTETESKIIDETILGDYQFAWGDDEKQGAIVLGYGSIYNHSENPNADWDVDANSRLMIFRATRDIPKGEEICTSYGWSMTDKTTPEWFLRGKEIVNPEK